MPNTSRMATISEFIKAKRSKNNIGLREAADDSGISASTLSRLERGIFTKMPDTETLKNLSEWLGISLSALMDEKKGKKRARTPQLETTAQVEVYLRADKNLSPDSAAALASAFKVLYKQFAAISSNFDSTPKGKKNAEP